MKKIILVDGNNLLFRSYYATAYTGNIMRNSKGFPTNAIFGLINMLNKIVKEENPEYMLVAFDKGKTFRHEKYKDYKAGRNETPEDLKVQFKLAKEIVDLMGIKSYEIDNYEADDIIGTYSKKAYIDKDFESVIISSDKDLLQLIDEQTEVKLLKQSGFIRMTKEEFIKTYNIMPKRMIDLKGLMGDSSDNIKGVKGIGEKTALKLLTEYETIDNIYNNIDNIKGSLKNKLIDGKESAFESRELATIYKDVPVEYSLEELKIKSPNYEKLKNIYEELEFNSFLKSLNINNTKDEVINVIKVTNKDEIKLDKTVAFYIELDKENYHDAKIIGASITDGKNYYYLEDMKICEEILKDKTVYTYDIKKNIVSLSYLGIKNINYDFDTMIASYILNYNVKDDISLVANTFNYNIKDYNSLLKEDKETLILENAKKVKFIFETKEKLTDELKKEDAYSLFNDIEMKLALVLSDMEITGIKVDKNILEEMGENIKNKIDLLTNEIYSISGAEFNIQSPKQLGEVLFDKMELPYPKKKKTSYSTSREILDKLIGIHPIIEKIIEYRTLTKIYNTYIIGIASSIKEDGKLHTIYTQTLTRTGRLSSIEPNLQNIPIRYKEGKMIRKAFIPDEDSLFLSSDYSQIELRIFAHLSNEKAMIDAFNNNIDIHTKTASEIFHVKEEDVTKNMRRDAKAVNFGILYGISSFGLSKDINTSIKEANEFIKKYMESFKGIKEYQQKILDDAYKNGYVKTIMNRKRKISELLSSNYMLKSQGERMALNTPIQGSSSDILKLAMINIYNEFKKQNIKSKMLLQIHDELVFNVKKDELEKVKKIVIDKMENAYNLNVDLKVEVDTGKDWYDLK